MRVLRHQSIRRQVLVIACGLLVPLALLAVWAARRTTAERDAEVSAQAATVATTAAAYLNQYLNSLDSLASAITHEPAVIARDREACDRLFEELLHRQPLLLNILETDTEGRVTGNGLPAQARLVSPLALSYVGKVIHSGQPLVTELLMGQITGRPTVLLAYPVRDAHDVVVGSIAFALNVSQLQTLFNDIPLPEGSVVSLTDSSSRVVARSRDADRYIGKRTREQPVPIREVPRTRVMAGPDGVERFYGNAAVDRGPWLLSVGIPTAVAAARLAPLWWRNVIITTMFVGCLLAGLLTLSELECRGVNRLREAAQRIADGDLSPPPPAPMPNQELADLGHAFVTMAASLRETRSALDRQIEQERQTAEMLQSLQRQVVRQERLAAVGLLASGVAHELNNPLQAIFGAVELLERQDGLSPEALEEIGFVKTQSGRAREIIRNLSRFGSQQSGLPTLVDLRETVNEVAQLRRRNIEAGGATLEIEVATSRPVFANATELQQVTLNFVINAQQALEAAERAGGRILVRVFDTGRMVRLEVQDNGPGVAPEDEPKLFQPFFTTKPVGKGTGLGLSVSYGIIDSCGGTIGQHPNEWGGATFFFELPAAEHGASAEDHDRSSVLHRSIPEGI